MKVGILGSGDVGQTLAKAFTAEGYEVMLGTRNTSKKEVVQFNDDKKLVPAILMKRQSLEKCLCWQ